MFVTETTEFQVDSCVLVIATYEKKLGLPLLKNYLFKENSVTL